MCLFAYSSNSDVVNLSSHELEKNSRIEKLHTLNITINKYDRNTPDHVLREKFKTMSEDRWRVYFTNPEDFGKKDGTGKDILGIFSEDYKTPANWKIWQSRYPCPLAFEYNVALPEYDASIITIGTNKFLAIEAPSDQNMKNFWQLIDVYDISHIVRLNAPEEYPEENYYPYWKHNYNVVDGCIKRGQKRIKTVFYRWPHRHGTETEELLKVVKFVHETADNRFIAVSCRAGAGRSGTFLAAYALFDDIQKQLSAGKTTADLDINIDRIVWEISIQRPFAITHCDQYITLYRFIDNLLDSKSKS
jgi:protein tyrosine phosphatase